MAATGEDDVTKVKDDVSKKEKGFRQKAKQDEDGTTVPKDEVQQKLLERPSVKLKMVTMQQKPLERLQVKLKMMKMQRRTLEKKPIVKLKVTWITKMLL